MSDSFRRCLTLCDGCGAFVLCAVVPYESVPESSAPPGLAEAVAQGAERLRVPHARRACSLCFNRIRWLVGRGTDEERRLHRALNATGAQALGWPIDLVLGDVDRELVDEFERCAACAGTGAHKGPTRGPCEPCKGVGGRVLERWAFAHAIRGVGVEFEDLTDGQPGLLELVRCWESKRAADGSTNLKTWRLPVATALLALRRAYQTGVVHGGSKGAAAVLIGGEHELSEAHAAEILSHALVEIMAGGDADSKFLEFTVQRPAEEKPPA